MKKYISANKEMWDSRVEPHLKSDFYQQEAFLNGSTSLKEIELEFLKDIKGKSVLHLQCHFGQDSISLAQMGADVTAVDFSSKAIQAGKELANKMDVEIDFVECDVLCLDDQLSAKFDLVFASYGITGWLPDLDRWADMISNLLSANGRFLFVEFHPFIHMFDEKSTLQYSYFHAAEPDKEENTTDYVEGFSESKHVSYWWTHSLSDTIMALKKQGLALMNLKEYSYSPYDCMPHMVEVSPNRFELAISKGRFPHVFALEMGF